jgi:triacylglycerol esterase/lipase EstA (alpha/beta hydrolase family)
MRSDPELFAGLSARRLLQLVLFVQALAAFIVAWALVRAGFAWWAALALALACVVLVRLVINMNNFAMAARAGGVVPAAFRLAKAARLRMLAQEFCDSMLVTSWDGPRGRARMTTYADSAHIPVLLLHGYGCNSGYWARLLPLLDAARISHASLDLEPLAGAIDAYVPAVEARVRALLAATGSERVAIVAHSMGGLVARAWMRAHGSARVARVITLGTPHHGTALARLGVGANARQMRRGDDPTSWLNALAASETPALRALVTSIYTHHDNIVAPAESSVLAGARNLPFGGVGHVALGRDARVLALVMRELDALKM